MKKVYKPGTGNELEKYKKQAPAKSRQGIDPGKAGKLDNAVRNKEKAAITVLRKWLAGDK